MKIEICAADDSDRGVMNVTFCGYSECQVHSIPRTEAEEIIFLDYYLHQTPLYILFQTFTDLESRCISDTSVNGISVMTEDNFWLSGCYGRTEFFGYE